MSAKNDYEMFMSLFTQADIPWRAGCLGSEEMDFDEAEDPLPDEDTYITVLDDDGDRIGFAFDEQGNFIGLKSYK
jgi:hypothetical protein